MRISTKPEKAYSLLARLVFWLQKKRLGMVLQPTQVWLRSPRLYVAFNLFYGAISRKSSPLDTTLISLINTRVAQINQCPFCIDLNSFFLEKQKISLEKITAISNFEKSNLFTEREQAALLYAEAMTNTNKTVTNELFKKIQQYFNENEIIELTACIAFENLSSKFNAALNIESHQLCQLSIRRTKTYPEKKDSNE